MKRIEVNHGSIHYTIGVADANEILKKEVKGMTVSMIIADVLKSKGISQAFLAEKSGIPYKRINYIVTENGDVKNDEIFKIADALNMDVYFFNPNSKNVGEMENE